jgi:hypothetical protein
MSSELGRAGSKRRWTLHQTEVYNTSPTGSFGGGGIWLAGGTPAVDAFGFLYLATGNGDFDGTANFGDSILRLNTNVTIAHGR